MRAFVLAVAIFLGLGSSPSAAQEAAPDPSVYTPPSKPSGFWGSGRPTSNANAYRWRMLAIGGVLVGATGLMMIRLVRRAERAKRERSS